MSNANSFHVVLVDDSSQARKLLRLMLQEIDGDIEVIGEADNADEGLEIIKTLQPQAVFLDIEMPGKTGLQLAEELIDIQYSGKVIFTTAYDQYAIKAFRLSALDYLLKPIQEDELQQAIQKLSLETAKTDELTKLAALKENLKEESNVLCIPNASGFEYIPLRNICYLEAEGSYVRIICKDKRQKVVSKNLKYFENSLDSIPKFKRTHRSYLVNMDEVVSFSKSDGGILVLSDGSKIPISRERRQEIEKLLK
jgi:two-component system, LytTR family, response regulator